MRAFIGTIVHKTQFGFVPVRTIHGMIDLFEATKLIYDGSIDWTYAQVLVLGFAKAYDFLSQC